MLCGREDVFVVGSGNSAGQAAMYFARFARTATIVLLKSSLVNISRYLVDSVESTANIQILANSVVTALEGDEVPRTITITNCHTNKQQTFASRWLFVCFGGVPHTDWAQEVGILRDDAGYLVTGPSLSVNSQPPVNWLLDRHPYYLETNVPGVFAAGDVRHGSVKRYASAVREGAMAVTLVHRYLSAV
jgi:thioredoxin reductase (NADPH)